MTKAEVIEFLKDYADDDEVIEITDIESNPWDIYEYLRRDYGRDGRSRHR